MECERKKEFTDPKFYAEVFETYLGDEQENGQVYDANWLSVISCYSQTMRSEIRDYFSEEVIEEINEFIDFSLDENIKSKEHLSFDEVEKSKEFMQKMINILSED